MKQIDIVHELNRMLIGYNITWDMVKYDADKAIMKINAHLGAMYPMMSEIMISPQHRYTIRVNNVDVPIFPERYILTVVIPYIATEVLARDEEFTTIYNKYTIDVDNGLFDMFQNEYNKVPEVFKQDLDVGVFFSKDIKEHAIHKQSADKAPKFTFNVYYHFNSDYTPVKQFTIDTNKYSYGSSAVIFAPTITKFIKGIYAYTWTGWSQNPNSGDTLLNTGDVLQNITRDIHLYAIWTPECVLTNVTGTVSIKDAHATDLFQLTIPDYIDGLLVTRIAKGFTTNASNLKQLVLPRTNFVLSEGAINNTALTSLVLPRYDYLRNKPDAVKLEPDAIKVHSLSYLYIPYSVSEINYGSIQNVPHIQCEIESKPAAWNENWHEGTDVEVDWGIVNG